MKNSKQTTLDLNGPILSFTSNPVGVATTGVISGTGSGIATFTGIATATFNTIGTVTNPASNTGYVTYRWYEVGVGALSDSTYVTGTATTTLTLSNLITPTDNKRTFYLTADYVPSAYGLPGVAVTVGSARSTGNAILEPISSGIATVTVYPLLEVVAQPTSSSAVLNNNTTFNVNAGLTDNDFSNDLIYQWYWDGVPVNDGTITTYETVNTTTTTTTFQTINETRYRTVTSSSQRSENRTYTSDGSVTLDPSSYDVIVRVASGSGGNGGGDNGGPGGAGGAGRFGRFFYQGGGRTLSWRIGRRGGDGRSGGGGTGGPAGTGGADGGRGGDAGNWSGAGGGGGGATIVYDSTVGRQTIIAAGGSGGGGGSWNRGGSNGSIAGGFGGGPINLASRGADGQSAGQDGGGGGASGGGSAPVGGGGSSGADNQRGGTGGGQTFGAYDSGKMTFPFDGTENFGDGYVNIEWKWTETTTRQEPYTETVTVPVITTTTTTQSVPRNTTLSGTNTPTLTVRSDAVGVNTVRCLVSSATAGNSPILTDIVQFNSVSSADQYNIQVETIGVVNLATISSINLFNGSYEFTIAAGDVNTGRVTNFYSFYAPDRDIAVEMDLYGGKGSDVGSYRGGEGGFSRVRFTMLRNTEYVIAGLTPSINTPFVYRKGQLIACVGSGGNAGASGNGGAGGGVGVSGQNGFNMGAGSGGVAYRAGTLLTNGIFGSLYFNTTASRLVYPDDSRAFFESGGRTLSCTKGVYWRGQGIDPCGDVGTTQFRLSDGTVVENTGSITRGFKTGYNIMETAGAAQIGSPGGNGGYGATGGSGGNAGGGGGGSGYTDGSVTVVTTTLGGSTGNARVILRRVG